MSDEASEAQAPKKIRPNITPPKEEAAFIEPAIEERQPLRADLREEDDIEEARRVANELRQHLSLIHI